MTDQLPGVSVHVNEGRLNGIFELPPADMPYISYQGRVMLVLLADAVKVTIGDTKDGETKASWVFKAVDAAVVREDNMRDHLANALYLDEDIPTPNFVDVPLIPEGKQLEGVYDEEGAFLGFETEDEDDDETFEEEEELLAGPERQSRTERVERLVVAEQPPERTGLFKTPRTAASPQPADPIPDHEEIEVYGRPVQYPDKVLAGFIQGGE